MLLVGLSFENCDSNQRFMTRSKSQSWRIRAEESRDEARIAQLTAESFGPGRYAKSAYRLREGVDPIRALSFVAVEAAQGDPELLRGSVRFWPIKIGDADALLLGPLAVQTSQRGRGIGICLMQTGIAAAHAAGWQTILLVGDESYYGRVGFSRVPPGRVRFPGPVDPDRILALSLKPDPLLNLCGPVRRARIDHRVGADGAGVG